MGQGGTHRWDFDAQITGCIWKSGAEWERELEERSNYGFTY